MYLIVYQNGILLFAGVAFTVERVVVGSTIVLRTYNLFSTAKYMRHAPIQEAVGIQVGTFVEIGELNGVVAPL